MNAPTVASPRDNAVSEFHPATRRWLGQAFAGPTDAQAYAWPLIQAGQNTLVAAPTGSGKTLAAFLAALDGLVSEGERFPLPAATRVLYVSPLRALSNDIHRNLELPLAGIRRALLELGLPDVEITTAVRTGDTSAAERERMKKVPPQVLVTTPESLYLLLTADGGRRMLETVQTVIIDEIHALAGSKRGAHLALSLERLEALCGRDLQRIGLSATQKPIERMARFLVGGDRDCATVDAGHIRDRDLALALPDSPLETVMSNEVWGEIYDQLETLIEQHRTTLIFVNTRRLAERAARYLAERLGEEAVTAHHGSLAKEHRLDAEQRLKAGSLRALIATASLELGIDIGDIDLVCQLGSPRSIAAFLQRVGRSGHALGKLPKGRLFPLSRDDLAECTALLHAANTGTLDAIGLPAAPRDVLAQQIVAEVAAREWDETALYERYRRAAPYADLGREQFGEIAQMVAEGYATKRGRRGAYLHRDAVNGKLRARRNARIAAATSGGVIPDQFDYDVVLSPEGISIGSVNEDFAFESLPGSIFQLGNRSYRILKVETARLFVEDAQGQPPNIPFWFGEAPGRSDELSDAVNDLRQRVNDALGDAGLAAARDLLQTEYGLDENTARQLADYYAAGHAALGALPTKENIVFERFFDEAGDQHLVIHSPWGSRINRAWGVSLRKRFCRRFNFELQAAALEDSIVISLGAVHSFPMEEVATYLRSETAAEVARQAVLNLPLFGNRWRWVATAALAILRSRGGKRTPPALQRAASEDLLSAVFPDAVACAENLAALPEIPDHPLVQQALVDCLTDAMDIDGFVALLQRLEAGQISVQCRELTAPSPLAMEVLNARPYAFLDDVPIEERRTLAIAGRGYLPPEAAGELARLDPEAIRTVCHQAWPAPRDADELHDALTLLGFMTEAEGLAGHPEAPAAGRWDQWLETLIRSGRATRARLAGGGMLWIAAERLTELLVAVPDAALEPAIDPAPGSGAPDVDDALRELMRSRLEGLGPVTTLALAKALELPEASLEAALLALEAEGYAMRGLFNPGATTTEWCERGLAARIHRYTLGKLRREIEPVSEAVYARFVRTWQGVADPGQGPESLYGVLAQLEGLSLPAAAWEEEVLPARILDYTPLMLDQLCAQGRVVWLRLLAPRLSPQRPRAVTPVARSPIAILPREHLALWRQFLPSARVTPELSSAADRVRALLREMGASFFPDLAQASGMLRTHVERGLAELVALGLVTSDSFTGLRSLIAPASKRPSFAPRRGRRRARAPGLGAAGRWSLIETMPLPEVDPAQALDHIAWTLLARHGVVFRAALEQEGATPPWRGLLYHYRRLEARGEIRGGRFVQRVAGEQFASSDAIALLRRTRREAETVHAMADTVPQGLPLH